MNNRKVLLFSEQPSASSLSKMLEDNDWSVCQPSQFSEALKLSATFQFNVALAMLGSYTCQKFFDQLEALICQDTKTNWIAITPKEFGNSENGSPLQLKLIDKYFFDYHRQPIELNRLLVIMGHAYGMAEISRIPNEYDSECYGRFSLIGQTPVMLELFAKISKIAQEHLSVLILGETGTGKELVARAIHANSNRAQSPFIAVNCGTLPESLVQTELFGHEKGAFTGAHKTKIGRIESAQGGTLFLDEIGDLPLAQQVNLLRFLEEKTILRVGGVKHVPVDVRVIAATNVELRKAIAKGEFREDLFYRLKELQLEIPPLRDRGEDIEMLSRYFFKKFSNETGNKIKGFSLGALYAIDNYRWPGNVRELANCIRKALIMSDNRLLSAADLDLDHRNHSNRILDTLDEARAEADRTCILASLHAANFNITKAAKILDISRVTLHRLIDKYQIKVNDTG